MGWRLWDHTADIGIHAEGDSPEEVLAHGARALTSIVTGKPDGLPLRGGDHQTFRVEAPDYGAMAVAFLSELLWLMESEGLLWVSGGMTLSLTDDGLAADVSANMVRFDTRMHGHGVEVKAVTYHDLFFGRDGPTWRLRVVLDI
ncbi:MAG: archease [Thermoplasmatota archaeon]